MLDRLGVAAEVRVAFDRYMKTSDRPLMPDPFRTVDVVFRVAGVGALVLLVATVTLGLLDVAAWRPVFTAAHVAALVALVPLGVALVRCAFREASRAGRPGIAGVISRYRGTALLLAVALVAVAVSLANFEDGNRLLRRVANFTTVGIALTMVVRYLRWRRASLPTG